MSDENTFRLSELVSKAVDEICALRGGISRSEAILLAISDELGLVKEAKKGSRLVLESTGCFGRTKRKEIMLLSQRDKVQFSALAPK